MQDDFQLDDFVPDDFEPDEDPNKDIRAEQAAKYPTPAEKGAKPGTAATAPWYMPSTDLLTRTQRALEEALLGPNEPWAGGPSPLQEAVFNGAAPSKVDYPGFIEGVKGSPVGAAIRNFITRPPLAELTEALHPNDLQFQKHAPIAMDELKAASTPPKNVEEALAAVDERLKVNHSAIDRIVDQQKDVDISDYRTHLIQKQKDAIPTDIDPLARKRLVAKIERQTPDKITVGYINKVRQETAATQSPFYGKETSGQLGDMAKGTKSIDIARGQAAREILYHALDNSPQAMGGGDAARAYNQRIGALIHMKDALQQAQNPSVAEGLSPLGEKTRKLRSIMGRPGHTLAFGMPKTIDEMIGNSVKNWNSLPADIPLTFKMQGFSQQPKGQLELMPSGGPGPALQENPGVLSPGQPSIHYGEPQQIPQQQPGLPFGNGGVEATPPPPSQPAFNFPPTEREQFLQQKLGMQPPKPGAQSAVQGVIDAYIQAHPDVIQKLKVLRGY